VAGYGAGYFGGFRGWSLLAVLIGKMQPGRLKLSRPPGNSMGHYDYGERAGSYRNFRG
jgi:hypothetical protein